MEVEFKELVISDIALINLENIFIYGMGTFSLASASVFIDELSLKINSLTTSYLIHPECGFLPTKHVIPKYHFRELFNNRITLERIEVLKCYPRKQEHQFHKAKKLKYKPPSSAIFVSSAVKNN